MIGPLVAAALWALAASLVLSVLLGALTAGLIVAGRPAAGTRQALWSLVLAASGLAPIAILAVMLLRGTGAGVPAAPPTLHVTAPAAAVAKRPGTPAPPQISRPAQSTQLRVPSPPNLTPLIAQCIVALWALGALIGLAGLGRSLIRVRALKGRSSPLDGPLATELPWLTTTPGREIYLRLSYETETPIAIGFRRPVILLPTEMATAEGLASIEPLIMHEYAHLARYDDWANLAQRVIERLFWFNPLVWLLGRRIALEREVAADEAVVARTHDRKRYASTLWRMAQEMRMPEHVVVAPGAMLTRKQISVRIERLLDDRSAGPRYVGAAAFAVAIVAAGGVAALAATAPPVMLAEAAAPIVLEESTDLVPPTIPVQPLPPLQRVFVFVTPKPAVEEHRVLSEQIQADVQRKVAEALQHSAAVAAATAATAAKVAADKSADTVKDVVSNVTPAKCIACDFSHRDLHGHDFSHMSLVAEDFSHANLRGATFRGSKLTGVDFSNAELDDADLSNTILTGVDLSGASMNGTNTTGMRLIGSSLP